MLEYKPKNLGDRDQYRGERVNGGHVREIQDKIKTTRKVENLHKRAFSLKGVLLKYAE
jgi:hypothetical protein